MTVELKITERPEKGWTKRQLPKDDEMVMIFTNWNTTEITKYHDFKNGGKTFRQFGVNKLEYVKAWAYIPTL